MNQANICEFKYAIYGGSFDPIHRAHVILADTAVKQLGLNELYFMPANVSPFKLDTIGNQTSASDRYAMIEGNLHYNSAFKISDYELKKEGPSYTIETLDYWNKNKEGKLYFILGGDSIVEIDKWYHGADILRKFPLVTNIRPGSDVSEAYGKIDEYRAKYGAEIHMLNMPPMDVSSTDIRNNIAEGISIADLVMPETEEYIIEHNLYK